MKTELTLKVFVNLDGFDKVPDKLEECLADELRNWCEGRYGFSVEMLNHAVNLVVRRAVNEAVTQSMPSMYTGKMVPWEVAGCKGQIAAFLVEAEEYMKEKHVSASVTGEGS